MRKKSDTERISCRIAEKRQLGGTEGRKRTPWNRVEEDTIARNEGIECT